MPKSTKLLVVYRVEYYCPRSGKLYWQRLKGGFLGLQDQTFGTQAQAEQVADGLIFAYHSIRVIDPMGNVVYQV